jgi:hypothetical protein
MFFIKTMKDIPIEKMCKVYTLVKGVIINGKANLFLIETKSCAC